MADLPARDVAIVSLRMCLEGWKKYGERTEEISAPEEAGLLLYTCWQRREVRLVSVRGEEHLEERGRAI